MINAITADELLREVARITRAGDALRRTPLDSIVSAIDGVATILADANSAEGREARERLPELTGYSRQSTEEVLAHMCSDWSEPSLRTLLESELRNPAILDGPVDGVFAHGPQLTLHIFSGNVPGVAVTSLIRALLTKSPSLGKVASGEPLLAHLFLRALQRVDTTIADAVAVVYWKGGDRTLEKVAIDAADTIVVYGGHEAVRQITENAGSHKRVLIHGPKLSFGLVGPHPGLTAAKDIARAVATYDQQGCVSPHVVFALHDARGLAERVGKELASLATTLPRRRLDAGEAMAIRDARSHAEFREIGGDDVAVFASDDTSYTVIYDSRAQLSASCLNRTLYVHPLQSLDELAAILDRRREVLQSAGIDGFDDPVEVTQLLFSKGVTRVSSFPDLPWPPMNWFHDGRGPINELLTYCRTEV